MVPTMPTIRAVVLPSSGCTSELIWSPITGMLPTADLIT